MSEPKPAMTKLATGRRLLAIFVANRQTLWLAGDYLLLQASTGYSERVRRFYFADIQSIVYARTSTGRDLSMVCAIIAALLVFIGFIVGSGENMSSVGLFIAALALFPLLGLGVNLVAGPTCACDISTAVHTERVLALNRITKVERVMGQILPHIDAAQGRLTGEMLGVDQPEANAVEAGRYALGDNVVRSSISREPGTLQGRLDAETPASDLRGTDFVEAGRYALEGNAGRLELRHEPGTFHRVTYILCLVYAATNTADIFVFSRLKNSFDGLLFAALIICVLVALRRQANSDLPSTVKNLSKIILAMLAASFVAGIFIGGYFFILNPERAMMGAGQTLLPRDSMVTQGFLVGATIAFAIAGIMGLIRLGRAAAVSPVVENGFTAPSTVRDDSL